MFHAIMYWNFLYIMFKQVNMFHEFFTWQNSIYVTQEQVYLALWSRYIEYY